MEESEVEAGALIVESVLATAALQREKLNNDIAKIEGVVAAIRAAQPRIEAGLTAAQSTVGEIGAIVQSLQGGADAAGDELNDLLPARDSVAGLTAQVLSGEAIEKIEAIRLLPEQFAEQLDDLMEDG